MKHHKNVPMVHHDVLIIFGDVFILKSKNLFYDLLRMFLQQSADNCTVGFQAKAQELYERVQRSMWIKASVDVAGAVWTAAGAETSWSLRYLDVTCRGDFRGSDYMSL